MNKKIKYIAVYMPSHQGVKIEEPVFDHEEDAWNWINNLSCKIDGKPNCESCQAEWSVIRKYLKKNKL